MLAASMLDIAHAFFDAVERWDMDAVHALYAPSMRFWINTTGAETSGEENIARQIAGKGMARSKTYDDRRIEVLADGFVAHYTITIVTLQDTKLALSACIVAQCNDAGQIVRIDEYLDAGKLPSRAAAAKPAAA